MENGRWMIQRCISDDEYGITTDNSLGSEVIFWNPVTTVSSNITPLLRLGYNIYNQGLYSLLDSSNDYWNRAKLGSTSYLIGNQGMENIFNHVKI